MMVYQMSGSYYIWTSFTVQKWTCELRRGSTEGPLDSKGDYCVECKVRRTESGSARFRS